MAIKYAPSTGDSKAESETKKDSPSTAPAKAAESVKPKKPSKSGKASADSQDALPGVEVSN